MAKKLKNQLYFDKLREFSGKRQPLIGVRNEAAAWCLVQQIEESKRRDEYVQWLLAHRINPASTDPLSPSFDPIKCAISFTRAREIDDACWMVFLATYFGRHLSLKWLLCGEIYGGGDGRLWTWSRVTTSTGEFAQWISDYKSVVRMRRTSTGFGNHRKYESLTRTAAAAESYVKWVSSHGGHQRLVDAAEKKGDPFDDLYSSLGDVVSFGRTARFDYLILLARVGLLKGRPMRPYLRGATGPLSGARLLIGGRTNANLDVAVLEDILIELCDALSVGCDVIEDAICNWQKSPARFIAFRG